MQLPSLLLPDTMSRGFYNLTPWSGIMLVVRASNARVLVLVYGPPREFDS